MCEMIEKVVVYKWGQGENNPRKTGLAHTKRGGGSLSSSWLIMANKDEEIE